jgi:hypothetical protein
MGRAHNGRNEQRFSIRHPGKYNAAAGEARNRVSSNKPGFEIDPLGNTAIPV